MCAAVATRCLVWPRTALELLFVKEPHLATVMTTLISRDITHKLLNMNAKLKTKDGNPLDLRLPGIAGRLKEMDAREIAKFTALANNNEEQHRRKAIERYSASNINSPCEKNLVLIFFFRPKRGKRLHAPPISTISIRK